MNTSNNFVVRGRSKDKITSMKSNSANRSHAFREEETIEVMSSGKMTFSQARQLKKKEAGPPESPRSAISPGIVKRIAEEREGNRGNSTPGISSRTNLSRLATEKKSTTQTPNKSMNDANIPVTSNSPVPRFVRGSTSSVSSIGNRSKDKYDSVTKTRSQNSVGNNTSSSPSTALLKSTPRNGTILKAAHNYISNATGPNINANTSNASGHASYADLPSLVSGSNTFDTADCKEVTNDDHQLLLKFEEAFSLTLKNNPGIVPGNIHIVDSIKHALFKLTKEKSTKESEMRKQLERVKAEKERIEGELRQEMGTTAVKRNELTKQLESVRSEKDRVEDSLKKQTDAIMAMKRDINVKMDQATKEKEELTKHLGFLSKSRQELESALETEMKLVEKDRDSLQKVIAERKHIQKCKSENKELERNIEKMTEHAAKEKAALQAEVEDLKAFEEHLKELKRKNEETRKELEKEKGDLMEVSRSMQTKKAALIESKEELESEMKKEIEDLELQIENSKIMHTQDMENMVKNRVMSYLRRGNGDVGMMSDLTAGGGMDVESLIKSKVERELEIFKKEADEQLRKKEEDMNKQLEEARRVVEMNKQLEEAMRQEEMKKRNRYSKRDESNDESDDDESAVPTKSRSKSKSSRNQTCDDDSVASTEDRRPRSNSRKHHDKGGKEKGMRDDKENSSEEKMRKEIELLREELRNNKLQAEEHVPDTKYNRVLPSRSHIKPTMSDPEDEIRGEIESLREDFNMALPRATSHRTRFAGDYASAPPARVPSSSSYRRHQPPQQHYHEDEDDAHLHRLSRKSIISPRYSHLGGRGGGYDDYEEEDDTMESRYDTIGRMHVSSPPLRQASPRSRPSGILKSRYYF